MSNYFTYFSIILQKMLTSSCSKIYNQIMQKIGTDNQYQFLIIALFTASAFQTTAILIGTSFIFMNPLFECQFQESNSQIVDEFFACSSIKDCKLINDYTIVGYLNLYCDKQYIRDMIQSSLPIGSILGLLIMNTLCDLKGRKWSVKICFLCELIGMIGTFLSVLLDLPYFVAFFQIVCAFGGYSLMMITYAIYYDVCNKQGVQNGIIALNIMWGITEISFYFFDNWIKQWYLYILFILILPTILLMYLANILLIDPPSFYLYKGEWSQVLQSCLKISTINKTLTSSSSKQLECLIGQYRAIRQRKSYNKHGLNHLLRKLFCRWKYLKRIILLSLLYGSGSFFYYGVEYAINGIGSSYGTNMLLLGFMETGAIIIIKLASNYTYDFPRKKAIAFFFATAGIIGIITMLPFITNSKMIITIAISLCRLSTTFGAYFFILIQTQSFSPDIRSTGLGLTEGISQIGSFLAPSILNMLINLKIYPLGIFSILLLIVGVIPALFLDQTAKGQDKKDEKLLNRQQGSYQVSALQIN